MPFFLERDIYLPPQNAEGTHLLEQKTILVGARCTTGVWRTSARLQPLPLALYHIHLKSDTTEFN